MSNPFAWLGLGYTKCRVGTAAEAVPTPNYHGKGSSGNWNQDKDKNVAEYKRKQAATKKSKRKQADKSKRLNRNK